MRGRRPKPTELKKLEGNPGKRALNKHEPKPDRGVPPCPKALSKEAKKEWRRVVKELDRLGILTRVDRASLAGYCQCWATAMQALGEIETRGIMIEEPIVDKEGCVVGYKLKKSPAVNIYKEMTQRYQSFGAEFGMSPSSRSRIQIKPPEDDGDPLKALEKRRAQMQSSASSSGRSVLM